MIRKSWESVDFSYSGKYNNYMKKQIASSGKGLIA